MIKVTYSSLKFDKKINESTIISIDSKELPNPQSYEEFISSIIEAFNLKQKGILLKAITKEDDDILIQDQQDLEDIKDETREYLFFLKDENENENETPLDIKIDLEVNLDISDKELEKIIASQIKEISPIDHEIINDENPFDIEKYKEEMNNKLDIIKNDFQKEFDKQINDIVLNKRAIMLSKISDIILDYSKVNLKNNENTINELKGMKEDSNELFGNIIEMNKALEEMNKPNKISVKFVKEDMTLEIDEKDSKNFLTPDIEIENVGNKTYKKLYFVLDEKNSSKGIYFYQNSKNINIHQLSLMDDFTPSTKQKTQIGLQIKDPEPNKTYDLYINAREDPNTVINISKSLKISVKIKSKPQKDQAKLIYKDLSEKYNLSVIGTQDELIKIIKELKYDINAIESRLKEKFEEIDSKLYRELDMADVCDENEANKKFNEFKYDQKAIKDWIIKQKKSKAELLYNKLNSESKITIDKNEVINKIIEFKFDEEKIKTWLGQNVAPINGEELLYDKLNKELEIVEKIDKNEVIKKIRELNCLENEIKNWLNQIKLLVEKFDEEFNILTIIGEEEFIAEIIRLDLVEDKIREYIEEKLNE